MSSPWPTGMHAITCCPAKVTTAARKQLQKMRVRREAERQEQIKAATDVAHKISQTSCTITVKTGEDEKLYGSVTNQDIAEALAAQDIVIDRHKIELEAPIKELGVFEINIKLHPDVPASIKVWVVEE